MNTTQSVNKKLLENKTYTKPIQHSIKIQEEVRKKKESDVERRQRLSAVVRDEFPDASEETLNAIVTRRIYEEDLKAHIPEDEELTLKPDISKTIRRDEKRVAYHNGKYEEQRFSEKKKMAWSCCQNKDKDSEGCVVKMVDRQKWTVSSC